MTTDVHSTAIVDKTARVGDGCHIGPYVVVEGETEIGDGCRLESHSVIKSHTTLGRGNLISEGVILGGLPQDLDFNADTVSYLRIGDDNVFRENLTIHRSATTGGETRVGNGTFLMSGSHIAHDCVVDDQVVIASNTALAGHVRIEDRAFISGGVVVHQFCQVGRLSMVAGNAKVERDVPPFCLADGVPARLRGLNLVGLRRAGLEASRLQTLKRAYRILNDRNLKLKDRLESLAELKTEETRHLLSFLKRSERGWLRSGD